MSRICGCAVSPILRYDVWKRSYRNARPKYLEAFVDNLINWEYVAEMFDKAYGAEVLEQELIPVSMRSNFLLGDEFECKNKRHFSDKIVRNPSSRIVSAHFLYIRSVGLV